MKFIFDKELWDEIISSLKKNPLRTILTSLGVIWGMFLLIVLIGSGTGLETGIRSQWGDFASNSMFFWGERTSIPYEGFPRGRQVSFTNKDVELIGQHFPELQYLSGAVWIGGQGGANNVVSRGKEAASFSIIGDGPDRFRIDRFDLQSGRALNEVDLEQKRKVIYIGQRVYETLYKTGEEAVGTYLKVNGIYFLVVGVFSSQHTGNWAYWQNGLVFMPLPTAQRAFNLGDDVYYFSMCAYPEYSITEVGERIQQYVKEMKRIHPDDKMAFGMNNIEEEFKQMNGILTGINVLIWVVGIFTLIAGVIGISNIMLIVVKERTKEIGVRRAIGAKPYMILVQIVYESVVLTLISGYFGLLAGVGVVELMRKYIPEAQSFKNPHVDLQIALFALGILVLTGLLAGLIPANRALKVKPVDALRYE